MSTYHATPEEERKVILREYKGLYAYISKHAKKEQLKKFHRAFLLAVNAHKDMRRRSGEPYIYHPIAVAKIVSRELNLGSRSMIAALLHDVVEDTDYTLEDIREIFGEEIEKIVDGLTKIESIVLDSQQSLQAENFRKILLCTSEDVRVILIKLADRLHNMRTLNSMPPEKQLKISSETSFFYVPIAHRLGLYSIKSELEDLAMKYYDPNTYNIINEKIKESEEDRKKLIDDFVKPIVERIKDAGIKAEMSSRTKSICSIYNKMKKKKINFEDVYDIFAVRFVIDTPEDAQEEIAQCWRVHTIVTSIYKINETRERNFITTPKANGYQALHTTVMSKSGKWIEVQIRSKRMDEIAEKGLAAHYKYKEENRSPSDYENRVEDWLIKIREMLKNVNVDALEFLDEIKMNLEIKEIIAFTPRGDRFVFPKGATVLDFAYEVHSKLGKHCIGAKVNYNIVPINYILKNGDQVEIITSKKQQPKIEWFDFVKTARAKDRIKEAIRAQQKKLNSDGETILENIFKNINIEFTSANVRQVQSYFKISSPIEFWSFIAQNKIPEERIKAIFNNKKTEYKSFTQKVTSEIDSKSLDSLIDEQLEKKPEIFLLDETSELIKHVVAPCCNPIPGDQVIGIQIAHDTIEVHQTICPKAIEQMSKYGNRIIKAKWRKEQEIAFLSGIRISGFDRKGMIKEIIDVVTSQLNLNIRSIDISTKGNVFTGKLMLYIQNLKALNKLIDNLSKIDQLEKIERISPDFY